MAAVGTRLGLRPPEGMYPDCPSLVHADVWQPEGQIKVLPPDMIFIGRGSGRVRLQRTAWASPFRRGADGDDEMCQLKYHHWLYEDAGRRGQLGSLRGKTLLCDCDREVCHGEVLVAACLEALESSKRRQDSGHSGKQRARRGAGGKRAARMLVAASAVAASAEGKHMQWGVGNDGGAMRVECRPWHHAALGVWDVCGRWQQEWRDSAVRRLFPYEYTKGQQFPYIEDILHRPTFCAFWSG